MAAKTLPSQFPTIVTRSVRNITDVDRTVRMIVDAFEAFRRATTDAVNNHAALLDSISALPTVNVRSSVNQTLTNAVVTAVVFNVEVIDTNGMWAVSPNPSRLTCPVAGTVILSGNIFFASNATGLRQIRFRKNGADFNNAPILFIPAGTTGGTLLNISSGPLVVAANDYFELYAYQNSGGDLDITGGAYNWASIYYIEKT